MARVLRVGLQGDFTFIFDFSLFFFLQGKVRCFPNTQKMRVFFGIWPARHRQDEDDIFSRESLQLNLCLPLLLGGVGGRSKVFYSIFWYSQTCEIGPHVLQVFDGLLVQCMWINLVK